MKFKRLIIGWVALSVISIGCQSATYVKAIDARVSLASLDDAKAILPFMDRGRVESMILVAPTPEDVIQAATAAYPERFMRLKNTVTVVVAEERPKLDLSLVTATLAQSPEHTVICPSFCGLVAKPKQLEKLLTAYPKLHVDIAFDGTEATQSGLLKISKRPEAMRQLMMRHPDRFLFASGLAIGSDNRNDEVEILGTFKGYRRVLEDAHYHFPKLSKLWERRGMRLPNDGALHGLFLPPDVLKKIYRENSERLF